MSEQQQPQTSTPKPPPPEGYYDFIAGEIAYDTSKKGDIEVVVQARFVVGTEERVGTARLNFSEAAKPYSIEKLQSLGYDGGSVLKLVGAKGRGRVKYETYTDEQTKQVKKTWKFEIVSSGGLKVHNAPPADRVASFEKMLGEYTPPGKAAKNGGAAGYPADWDGGAPSGADGFSLED